MTKPVYTYKSFIHSIQTIFMSSPSAVRVPLLQGSRGGANNISHLASRTSHLGPNICGGALSLAFSNCVRSQNEQNPHNSTQLNPFHNKNHCNGWPQKCCLWRRHTHRIHRGCLLECHNQLTLNDFIWKYTFTYFYT